MNPELSSWFSQSPRFLPGKYPVAVVINGVSKGSIATEFDENGQPCISKLFMRQAGLLLTPKMSEHSSCIDLKEVWPQTEVSLEPAKQSMSIVLPDEAVIKKSTEHNNWTRGGVAGLFNYDAQYLESRGGQSRLSYISLNSEAGLNANEWIFRSRQALSQFNGIQNVQHQGAYAQRTFIASKQVLQVGQIALSNALFGTGQVIGVQVFPESALTQSAASPVQVEGIADSQSVVEVRQAGILIYSTTVPAGPFKFQGLPLSNARSDLEVELTNIRGEKRTFSVPASTFLFNGPAISPGISYGVGKLDQQGDDKSPLVGTLAKGWLLTPASALQAGILGSKDYQAGALAVDTRLWRDANLSIQGTSTHDLQQRKSGNVLNAALNYRYNDRVNFNLNAGKQSSGYRDLSDSVTAPPLEEKFSNRSHQIGAGVGFSMNDFGSASLSLSRTTEFNGQSRTYVRGSWNKKFSGVYLGANIEQSNGSGYASSERRIYLTLSVPIGSSRSVSSSLTRNGSSLNGGIQYYDRSDDNLGWSLSTERDFQNGRLSNGAGVDIPTPVSQLNGMLSQSSDGQTGWGIRASGGVVAHQSGVMLSPSRVGDTFGVAKVGDEAGVKLDTSNGPTWTNSRGYAVLPSLNGYSRSTVQIDTRSLAKKVDVANAWYEASPARGSVEFIEFNVVRTRRVLVNLQATNGSNIPRGAAVFDAAGKFVTVVGDEGRVFIPDASSNLSFDVQQAGSTICVFSVEPGDDREVSGLYETATAQCS